MSDDLDLFELQSVEDFISISRQNEIIDYLDISTIRLLTGDTDKKSLNLTVVLTALFSSLNQGSSSLKLDFETISKKLPFMDLEKLKGFFTSFKQNLDAGRYGDLIGEENDYKPIIYHNNALYFQKYFFNEKKLDEKISGRLVKEGFDRDYFERARIAIKEVFKSCKINLDKKQKIAAINSALLDFFIISGGPGTGKTTIITTIIVILLKLGYSNKEIAILSPTGRAALRVMESIQNQIETNFDIPLDEKKEIFSVEAKTIHRILKYNPLTNKFSFNEKNLLPVKALVVDEVSMVDLVLMSKLLRAVSDDTKVIFVGDKNQLPSVEAGAVLNRLIPENNIEYFDNRDFLREFIPDLDSPPPPYKKDKLNNRFVILDKPYRYGGNIQRITENIKKGENINSIVNYITEIEKIEDIEKFDFQTENCFIVENKNSKNKTNSLLNEWLSKNFTEEKKYLESIEKISSIEIKKESEERDRVVLSLFKAAENSKILTLLREGVYGRAFINKQLKESYVQKTGCESGIPLIITKNDYDKNIYNGDTSIMVKDITGKYYCLFKIFGKIKVFDAEYINNYETAFAITVHKSQGSEYDNIFFIFPSDDENKLLKRELVYTGLTRAKKYCYNLFR